jgi:hypothetical protein
MKIRLRASTTWCKTRAWRRTLLGSGLSYDSINAVGALLRIGRREEPLLLRQFGRGMRHYL